MPLTVKQKSETIKTLRKFFNHTDLELTEPGRSLEFSEQVESDVQEILAQNLHKGLKEWGARCKAAREKTFFTYDDVGELLSVTHKCIQYQENKSGTTNVDPFYLEAFSLIYRQSPYLLLGLPNPHMVCPFSTLTDKCSRFSNVIINCLYDENDPDKLALLRAITKIGKLTSPKYTNLITVLKDASIFSDLFSTDPLEHSTSINNGWRNTRLPSILPAEAYGSETYQLRHTFWEAYYVLNDLCTHNPIRLQTLAQLALCDIEAARVLQCMILDTGFPKDPKSLRHYNVDAVLIQSDRNKQKSARGFML